MDINQIHLSDYWYNLPDEKIAKYPLAKRDRSKLLVYKGKLGNIKHNAFMNMAEQLPADASLFFNNTKVIPARLLFHKATGATIEIFLLEPESFFRNCNNHAQQGKNHLALYGQKHEKMET